MRINSLATAPDRAGRYRITLEDGSVMRLYRQTVEDFGLYAGLDLSEAQLQHLTAASQEMSAKMRAVRIVSASSVSKWDLERRLIQKGEDPDQAKAAVAWMSDLSLLDDRKVAEQLVSRCIGKGYGRARAKQMLYEKRIPKELWEEALAQYPDQQDKIVAFLQDRLRDGHTDKDVKRAVDALLRRGHSYGQIRRALQQLNADFHEFSEE